MSDETEKAENKKAKLKDKLKAMGVMHNENAEPSKQKSSVSENKFPLIFGIIVVVIMSWWYINKQSKEADTTQVATSTTPSPYGMPAPGYGPGTAPGVGPGPGFGPGADLGPMPPVPPSPPDYMLRRYEKGNINGADAYKGDAPSTRADDRYGPAPGWGPAPYGYYAPPPPPPPAYNPWYGYGPAPYYADPYFANPYSGYYGPPPYY